MLRSEARWYNFTYPVKTSLDVRMSFWKAWGMPFATQTLIMESPPSFLYVPEWPPLVPYQKAAWCESQKWSKWNQIADPQVPPMSEIWSRASIPGTKTKRWKSVGTSSWITCPSWVAPKYLGMSAGYLLDSPCPGSKFQVSFYTKRKREKKRKKRKKKKKKKKTPKGGRSQDIIEEQQ